MCSTILRSLPVDAAYVPYNPTKVVIIHIAAKHKSVYTF